MKSKQVLKLLQVSRVTLSKYVKTGLIKVTMKKNKTYDYDEDSIYSFLGKNKVEEQKLNIIYARTSNPPKKYAEEQSQRILNFCTSKGIQIDKIFIDVKSGMNFQRIEFLKLIDLIINNKVKLVVIENKDRLVRFGFELLQELFKKFGCEILIVNNLSEKTYEQELTEDLISIIHYFSMKSYSNRRKLNKIKEELQNNDNIKNQI